MDTLLFILKSIVLGIVEGVTEFLPISSTGHLIIFEKIMKFTSPNPQYVEMYTYVIQLGAILAVVLLYWKKIRETIINFFPQKVGYENSGFKFWFMIFIACLPGAVVKLLLDKPVETYLSQPVTVAIVLILGGIWMIYAENKFRNNNRGKQKLSVTPKQAIIIGLFQCLAIIPGMSRSASTIIGAWVAGLSTVIGAEFSFFLAIPVMFGYSLLEIIKIGGFGSMSAPELGSLATGFIVAFVVAVAVISKFISYLKRKPMKSFAIYRMIFAVVVLIAGFLNLF
jgi:undecaprenyl-diphosphatase